MSEQESLNLKPSVEQSLKELRTLFMLPESACRYWSNLSLRYREFIAAEAGLPEKAGVQWEQFNDSERVSIKTAIAGLGAVMQEARGQL